MKFGFVGRAWVRYFRPRATSVSPKIEFGNYSASFRSTRWKAEPTLAHLAPEPAKTAMLKPPPDPAVDRRWSEWLRERETFSLPGWTYCRFPIQFPGDRAVFVFGMVRDSFGVYHTPFKVRHPESAVSVETILACMVHMRTGCGMGLFENRQVAAQACELAEKVEQRWGDVDPQDPVTWREIISRVGSTWRGAGIIPDRQAHNDDGQSWNVYGITTETMMQGRPEKLS